LRGTKNYQTARRYIILGEHWHINLEKLANVTIPTTLVEVLQARSDSLGLEERVLLQRASVIGRIFWDNAVGSMEADHEDKIQLIPRMEDILSALSSREMIFPSDSSAFESNREFVFKHTLLRDVTYESVLKRLRKVYHAYAAAWLESVTQQSGRSDEYAALIADHYDRAEDVEKACQWYRTAGNLAAERYANAESIRCLSRCLELTPKEDLAGQYELLLKRVGLYDLVSDRSSQKRDLEILQVLAEQLDRETADEKTPEESMKSYRAEVFMQSWHYYDAWRLPSFYRGYAASHPSGSGRRHM
jgi:predicted ATPase